MKNSGTAMSIFKKQTKPKALTTRSMKAIEVYSQTSRVNSTVTEYAGVESSICSETLSMAPQLTDASTVPLSTSAEDLSL
jgi:hypothetical protein